MPGESTQSKDVSMYGETYKHEGVKRTLEGVKKNEKLRERFEHAGRGRAEDMFRNGRLGDIIAQGNKVLDAGNGVGYLAQKVKEQTGVPVVQVDLYDHRMDSTKDTAFVRGNARELPIATGSMDVVLLADILHHTKNPEELLAEARRVVKDGGKIIVFEDTIPDASQRFKRRIVTALTAKMDDAFNQQPDGVNPHNYHSPTEWEEMFQQVSPGADVTKQQWYWGARDFLPGKLKPGFTNNATPDRFFESTCFVIKTKAQTAVLEDDPHAA